MSSPSIGRRSFLKSAGLAAGAACLAQRLPGVPALVSPEARRSRPNILFIFTDQQHADAMSCAGQSGLYTPAMDSLAARGLRLCRAYCFQPLCTPSRTNLMTGRPARLFGTRVNNLLPRVPSDTPTVGRLLQDSGYDTAYVGKWHVPLPETDSRLHGYATMRGITNAGDDSLVAQPCDEILRQNRARPLFLTASIINPHDICEHARGQKLPNGDIAPMPPPEECPELPANCALHPDEPEALAKIKGLTPKVFPTAGWSDDRWRQYRWAYNRLVEKADAEVARILESLAASGMERDTLVIFSSDHGDGDASHRWNQKTVLYEESLRVPFIVAGPGVKGRARLDKEHLVSLGLDFLPTLCDYAGVAAPAACEGRSARPVFESMETRGWRDHLVAETEFHLAKNQESSGIRGRSVLSRRFKYTIYNEGANREQFFDLGIDPGETLNRLNDPSLAGELARHRRWLVDWATRTGDDFPLVRG